MVSTAPARKDPTDRNEERITFLRIVVLLLALALGMSIPVEVLLATRGGGKTVVQAPAATGSMAGMAGMTAAGAAATPSFAGAAPENADALAAAHKPYDAALPPLQTGDVVKVNLVLKDITVQIAPGVKYAAWAWAGGAPGPVIHVRQGQTVKITLTNNGAIPHSVDFHAGRVAPNKNFIDVFPGKSFTLQLQGERPGRLHVPLRHQAGADAHRERHVRRDRRRAANAAAARRQAVRARCERVVPRPRTV